MADAHAPRTPQQQENQQQSLPDGSVVKVKIDQTIQNDPVAISRIKKAILASRQGPTTRAAASHVDWQALAETLGQPFDAELVPFSKLRQMRRDPMIGFGLHYVKTPLVRAPWRIKCPDPQVAAFVDAAIRPIYARLIFQYCLSLDFGFSAISKQFKQEAPQGTYIDANGNEAPVWSEGNILPTVYKTFIALPPEDVKPAWDEKTGEFNGIIYEGEEQGDPGGQSGLAAGLGAKGSGAGNEDEPTIDVYHSLWATNDKDSVFGSIWGYPRIAYAYRYWWSYWFRWALADRAFERQAVPPIVGYHPEGQYEDEDGARFDNMDVILEALSEIRSGGNVALPSDVHEGTTGAGTVREWEIKYLEGGQPNWDFDKTFNYLDVMKLRSLWVPEQAFVEGEGGTSSRNVAAQMAEIFVQSQSGLMAEIDDHINKYVIPHLLVINFPEFVGECTKVTTGFSSDDVEFMKQIIQLVGQQSQNPATALQVDIRSAMERVGVPLLTPTQVSQQEADLVRRSALTAPPETAGIPGAEAAVVPAPGSVTGFSYADPGELIALSSDADFVSRLPQSEHFSDKRVKSASARLQTLWAQRYADCFTDFAKFVQRELDSVELADEDSAAETAAKVGAVVLTAAAAKKLAEKIAKTWTLPAKGLKDLTRLTGGLLARIVGAAASIEGGRVGSDAKVDSDSVKEWTDERLGHLLATTEDTMRRELGAFLAGALEEGGTPDEIADRIRDHFDGFPKWKADRVARTEAQTAYNVGTIFAARSVGSKQLLAHDASDGTDEATDEECKDRHGKVFPLPDALRENDEEHPNGTLYFTIVPPGEEVAVEAADDSALGGALAFYDAPSNVVFFSEDLDPTEVGEYMVNLVDALQAKAREEAQ